MFRRKRRYATPANALSFRDEGAGGLLKRPRCFLG